MISAYKTALYLSKKHEVVVLTTGTPRYEKINDNLTVYRLRDLFLPDPVNYSIVPGLFTGLASIIKKEKPTHYLVNKNMFFTSFAIVQLRLMGKKVITATDTFPGINWFPRNPFVKVVMSLYAHLLGMPLLKLSTKVVLFHAGLKDVAEKYKLKYTIIPNGVDLAAIDAASANAELLNKKVVTVTYVGRLETIKGYDDIIAVAQELTPKHKNVRFVFVGTTAKKEALVAEVQNEQIVFLGHRTDVASLMKASDIFVLASYSEGLPNALMEAMACELACVSSNVGGVKVLINEGKNGLLFEAGDRVQLAQHIETLVGDEALRKSLGKAARTTILKTYTWEAISEQYADLFEKVGGS